jgi:hypothetical protein
MNVEADFKSEIRLLIKNPNRKKNFDLLSMLEAKIQSPSVLIDGFEFNIVRETPIVQRVEDFLQMIRNETAKTLKLRAIIMSRVNTGSISIDTADRMIKHMNSMGITKEMIIESSELFSITESNIGYLLQFRDHKLTFRRTKIDLTDYNSINDL